VTGRAYARIAWTVAAAIVAVLGYGVYRAGLGEVPHPPSDTSITFTGGFANGHRIKTRAWRADYDKIVSNADQTILDLYGIRNGEIDRDGRAYLRVRAAHMTVNTVSRDFTVAGPLHVESAGAGPHRSFDTTAALWSDAAQRLTLTKPIVIHSGGEEPLRVGSLTFDVKTGDIVLQDVAGPVRFK
jgi:hypothetical protein